MNWFERWHEIGREGAKRQDEFIEKHFDPNTYTGMLRGLLFWGIAWYVLCHFYDIMDWFHDLMGGRQSDPVKPSQVSWVRLCASIICGAGILIETIALFILSIKRYIAWKYNSKQGQKVDVKDW